MKEKPAFVFNGFLQLPNLERLAVVNAINEFFDSTEREPIREEAESKFAEMRVNSPNDICPCCGR